MTRLMELYKKTKGGHLLLTENELKEYAGLRKREYQDRKTELEKEGKTHIQPYKDDSGDIIGWTFKSHEIL